MKVRLKTTLTIGVNNYPERTELEFPNEQARELIELGLAEPVKEGKKRKK